MKFELLVKLVVPDNTASTAKRTAIAMGYPIVEVQREDYYEFETEKDISEQLAKTDILVNANKHKCVIKKEGAEFEKQQDYTFHVLVKDKGDNAAGLLATLKERLGFTTIKNMNKGTMWTLIIKADSEDKAKKVAEDITENLLYNKHYQDYQMR